MKVLLNIKDDKVSFMMELLKNFKFVKTEVLSENEEIIEDVKQGVKEINLIKTGKKQARDAEEFIYELQSQNH